MGYDLHITRRAEWADRDGPEITLKEWEAYVRSDDEVRIEGNSSIPLDEIRSKIKTRLGRDDDERLVEDDDSRLLRTRWFGACW